jgi:hypothetical protein
LFVNSIINNYFWFPTCAMSLSHVLSDFEQISNFLSGDKKLPEGKIITFLLSVALPDYPSLAVAISTALVLLVVVHKNDTFATQFLVSVLSRSHDQRTKNLHTFLRMVVQVSQSSRNIETQLKKVCAVELKKVLQRSLVKFALWKIDINALDFTTQMIDGIMPYFVEFATAYNDCLQGDGLNIPRYAWFCQVLENEKTEPFPQIIANIRSNGPCVLNPEYGFQLLMSDQKFTHRNVQRMLPQNVTDIDKHTYKQVFMLVALLVILHRDTDTVQIFIKKMHQRAKENQTHASMPVLHQLSAVFDMTRAVATLHASLVESEHIVMFPLLYQELLLFMARVICISPSFNTSTIQTCAIEFSNACRKALTAFTTPETFYRHQYSLCSLLNLAGTESSIFMSICLDIEKFDMNAEKKPSYANVENVMSE